MKKDKETQLLNRLTITRQAIDCFETALRLCKEQDNKEGEERANKHLAKQYHEAGCDFGTLGDYTTAEGYFKETLRIDPDHTNAHFNLGSIYRVQKKFDLAEKELKLAIEQDNNRATFHNEYGLLLAAIGRNEDAIKEYDIAISLWDAEKDLGPG